MSQPTDDICAPTQWAQLGPIEYRGERPSVPTDDVSRMRIKKMGEQFARDLTSLIQALDWSAE